MGKLIFDNRPNSPRVKVVEDKRGRFEIKQKRLMTQAKWSKRGLIVAVILLAITSFALFLKIQETGSIGISIDVQVIKPLK